MINLLNKRNLILDIGHYFSTHGLKFSKEKLTTHWMGPYEVVTAFDNGSVKIKTIDGSTVSFVVNGHRLRLYHEPTSKQDFIKKHLQQNEMELVEGEAIPPPPNP